MRPIVWLQVSDFHLRDDQAWAQDVALSAMCQDISRRRKQVGAFDFILASGDLAFSGKEAEYIRVSAFFDELANVSGVPKEKIFCIPGNHDIDRKRQTTCFAGARHLLKSPNDVDEFINSPEEIETLLKRQGNYCRFQETYFAGQQRTWTTGRLGYVSILTVDELRIAILGLNSGWLANGGASDHAQLLIGERQVLEAVEIAKSAGVNLTVAMSHHPFHLLNDFDRRSVQFRIERDCQFYHCGHLHQPETRETLTEGQHCLAIAAGASFETRHTDNTFTVVTLDVMSARRAIVTAHYNATDKAFSHESSRSYSFVLNVTAQCSVDELAAAIESHRAALAPVTFYLAALLLEAHTEVPIQKAQTYAFGSVDVLTREEDSGLKSATMSFLAVRNPLRLLTGRKSLADIVARYGDAIVTYGTMLCEIAESGTHFAGDLASRDRNARALAGIEPVRPLAHTITLMDRLAQDEDWPALRDVAERNASASDPGVAIHARRMIALALAHSSEPDDRKQSARVYNALIEEERAKADDFAALAILRLNEKDVDGAKAALRAGIETFPDAAAGYQELGQRIVEETGDRAFRDELRVKGSGGKAQ